MIEGLLQQIGKKLHLPDHVTRRIIDDLHAEGIYILETLSKLDDWTPLKIPTAVQRELKEKITLTKSNTLACAI